MKKSLLATTIATVIACATTTASADTLQLEVIGHYSTGLADGSGDLTAAETVAVRGERLYVTNASDVSLDIVDISTPSAPVLVRRVDLGAFGSVVNSVDVSSKNLVAVAVQADDKVSAGTVVFLSPEGKVQRSVAVGSLPDMVAFTPDGKRLLVANEGEPNCYGPAPCVDPEGSISVISLAPRRDTLRVDTIGFAGLDIAAGVRIFGPGASAAQDLEPEYITVAADSSRAWVTLQENNAIAELDLATLQVTRITALGFKDHAVDGAGLDPSDRDNAIAITPRSHVLGMYQPDSIAAFNVDGRQYLITANEGDAREYPHPTDPTLSYVEASRARNLRASGNLGTIPGIADNAQLGRLNVTTAPPGGDLDKLYAFGARSVSIWDAATGAQVWDSGDTLEQQTALRLPDHFNASNSSNSFDNRSDDKGPEPEAVAVGRIHGVPFAFVGLERVGGLAVFDLSDPAAPTFVDYVNNRDFGADPVGPDSGPEVVRFVKAEHSPTGRPLVVVSNEISGTVTLLQDAE